MKDLFVGKMCVVRTNGAGVFFGEVFKQEEQTCVLRGARRIWFWSGANSLSDLAVNGVAHPTDCKFPTVVGEIAVFGVIEIIPATEKAIQSIQSVPEWTYFKG